MVLPLTIILLTGAFLVRQLLLRAESQSPLRRARGAWHRRAMWGAALVRAGWLLYLGTLILGATSPHPLGSLTLWLAGGIWITALLCTIAGLWLRRGDPEQRDVATTALAWAAFAVDPYVGESFTALHAAVLTGLFLTIWLALRYYRRHQRGGQSLV